MHGQLLPPDSDLCFLFGRGLAKGDEEAQVDPERFQNRTDELWALGSKKYLRIRRRSYTLLEERMEVCFAFNLLRIWLVSTSRQCRETQEQAPPLDKELENTPQVRNLTRNERMKEDRTYIVPDGGRG